MVQRYVLPVAPRALSLLTQVTAGGIRTDNDVGEERLAASRTKQNKNFGRSCAACATQHQEAGHNMSENGIMVRIYAAFQDVMGVNNLDHRCAPYSSASPFRTHPVDSGGTTRPDRPSRVDHRMRFPGYCASSNRYRRAECSSQWLYQIRVNLASDMPGCSFFPFRFCASFVVRAHSYLL